MVEYLSGGRIQGISNETVAATPTFFDPIDDTQSVSGDWTFANADSSGANNYDAGNNWIDFHLVSPDGTNEGAGRDDGYIDTQDNGWLNGSSPSDTAFAFKFKLKFTTLGAASANENRNYFGFFDKDNSLFSSQDRFTLQVNTTFLKY